MAEHSRPRSGCSRRCSIGSPTTSRTRSRSRASARVMSKSRLRQAVLRDLAWLFNATRLEAVADLANAPYVRRSVLNFGLPALSGQDGLVARRRRPRARDPPGDPRLRAAHPAGHARGQGAARGRRRSITTTSSASRFTASSGRSRCRWSCWSAPRSTSRPARSRSPISLPSRVA